MIVTISVKIVIGHIRPSKDCGKNMKKEIFDNYNGLLFCESCNKMIPKTHMNYRRVKSNFVVSKCNVDMWLDRHKNFTLLNGFTMDETKTALHFFLYNNECILNDIATSIGKSLDDIIKLYYYLNIKGKHIKIRTTCAKCGKEIYKFTREYLIAKNNYCCVELIIKFIDSLNNHYQLLNYHSFNWSYTNQLKLNSNLIIPFQSQSIENYRKYFTTECVTTAVE